MALRQPLLTRVWENTNEAILPERAGISRRLKKVLIRKPYAFQDTPIFVEYWIVTKIVQHFQVSPDCFNIIHPNLEDAGTYTLFTYLADKGHIVDYPLEEGEDFSVKTTATVEEIRMVYEEYDAGDQMADMPQGSRSFERVYLCYGTNKEDINESGWVSLKDSFTHERFVRFPFIERVPSGYDISVLGMMAADYEFNYWDGTTNYKSRTMRIRLEKGLEILHSEDEKGWSLVGTGTADGTTNFTYLRGYNDWPFHGYRFLEKDPVAIFPSRIRLFEPPLVFKADEALDVKVYCDVDPNAPINSRSLNVCFVLHIKPV